jgi:hydroxyacylglutathione hydrolase
MSNPPKMQIAIIPVTPFQQNASIVVCTTTNMAAIVDPGGDIEIFKKALLELKATPEKIILTHGHIDHAGGAAQLAQELNIPIIGPHKGDEDMMLNLPATALKFGMSGVRACASSQWLDEGDSVNVGEITFEVRHVPGHSPGSVVFINHDQHFALVGDTLFQGSIGRTDFENGNHDELIENIHTKLFTLSDDYTILPGHGAASTIGLERKNNPFLRVN